MKTGKICFISELIGTGYDLDPNIHKGFTVGKGKVMYWYLLWPKSGNVTVVTPEIPPRSRWLKGDTEITIHFTNQ